MKQIFLIFSFICFYSAYPQWNQIFCSMDTTFTLTDCHLFNDSTGIIIGHFDTQQSVSTGLILKSESFNSWDTVKISPDTTMSDLLFVNDSTGYATYKVYNTYGTFGVLKTSDGGNTWAPISIIAINAFPKLSCYNDSILIYNQNLASGISYDGGYSWSDISGLYSADYFKIKDNIFISCGGGFYCFSNDTLNSFSCDYLGQNASINGLDIDVKLNGDTMLVFSAYGTQGYDFGYPYYNFGKIYIVKNHDVTSFTEIHFPNGRLRKVLINDNSMYAVPWGPFSSGSTIIKSMDEGKTWFSQDVLDSICLGDYRFVGIESIDSNTLYASTFNAIYLTTNGGGALGTQLGINIQTLSTTENNQIIEKTNIYPNPHQDYFTIEATKNSDISVFSTSGALVLTHKMNSENEFINTSKLESGLYYVRILNKFGSLVRKIIKE